MGGGQHACMHARIPTWFLVGEMAMKLRALRMRCMTASTRYCDPRVSTWRGMDGWLDEWMRCHSPITSDQTKRKVPRTAFTMTFHFGREKMKRKKEHTDTHRVEVDAEDARHLRGAPHHVQAVHHVQIQPGLGQHVAQHARPPLDAAVAPPLPERGGEVNRVAVGFVFLCFLFGWAIKKSAHTPTQAHVYQYKINKRKRKKQRTGGRDTRVSILI